MSPDTNEFQFEQDPRDEWLSKRENALRWRAHDEDHKQIAESIRVAIAAVERERALHVTAHDAAHVAHEKEHDLNGRASGIATAAHAKEHALEAVARDKAEDAIDKRLAAMNEFRQQLKDQSATFARIDALATLTERVIAIEKLDIKGEGRTLGQGAVLAVIVGAVSFVGTVLGIIIIIANFATKA